MSDWIVLFLFGGAVILALVLVARYQAGRYQDGGGVGDNTTVGAGQAG